MGAYSTDGGQVSQLMEASGRVSQGDVSVVDAMRGDVGAGRCRCRTFRMSHIGWISLTLDGSTPILSGVQYEPFGPLAGWSWGSGTLAVRGYDPDGQVQYIDSAGLTQYSRDTAQRITGISDASNAALSQSYGYDALDRLTSAGGMSVPDLPYEPYQLD